MSRNQRIAVVASGVILFLAAGLFIRLGPRNREPFLAEAVMPDGKHRLRLLKIVQGPLTYDWKDPTPPLLRLLPAPWSPPSVPFATQKLDGVPLGGNSFGRSPKRPDGISFLFRVVDERGEYAVNPTAIRSVVEFEESTGFRFGPVLPEYERLGLGILTGCRASVPRRDRRLKIRVTDQSNLARPTRPMVFEIDNPFFKPPGQEWVPAELPASVAGESMSATLKSIRIRGSGFIDAQISPSRRGFMADPTSFWLEDASGNRGALSPFEPAWKLHAEVIPVGVTAVRADEVQSFGTIELPGWKRNLISGKTVHVGNVELKLENIWGGELGTRDDGLPEGQWESSPGYPRHDRPQMFIEATGIDERQEVVTQITVDGQAVETGNSTTRERNRCLVEVALKRPGPGAVIQLEVAVARRESFEFVIKPVRESEPK